MVPELGERCRKWQKKVNDPIIIALYDIFLAIEVDDTPQQLLQTVSDKLLSTLGYKSCSFADPNTDSFNNNDINEFLAATTTQQHTNVLTLPGRFILAIPAQTAGLFVCEASTPFNDDTIRHLSSFICHVATLHTKLFRLTKLEEQNQKFRMALKAGGIGTWELDTVTREVRWDDQMFSLFDVDKQYFTGTYTFFKKMVHNDDAPTLFEIIDNFCHRSHKDLSILSSAY